VEGHFAADDYNDDELSKIARRIIKILPKSTPASVLKNREVCPQTVSAMQSFRVMWLPAFGECYEELDNWFLDATLSKDFPSASLDVNDVGFAWFVKRDLFGRF
jgi:hypothetical protein